MSTTSSIALKTTIKSASKPASKTAVTKDVQKLQRAIVVFDTEHLSSLFERVVVASGTSNRQTKALAASVVDAVRDAGFAKPRVEGEENGEWIIVDCGPAVVHVMQPNIRMYYNLEELWGEKPVRLKLGAAKPQGAPSARVAPAPVAAKSAASLRRSSAAKKGVEEAFPSRAQMQKNALAKAVADKKAAIKSAVKPRSTSSGAAPAPKPRVKVLVVNAPGKPSAKPAAKKAAAPRTAAKPAAAKRAPARKA